MRLLNPQERHAYNAAIRDALDQWDSKTEDFVDMATRVNAAVGKAQRVLKEQKEDCA